MGNLGAAKRAEWAKKNLTIPDNLVFCENATIARHHVKRKIIERKLIPYECAICKNDGTWLGKPLPLILDHVNGKNNDNRLDNLRFVCSNCDSQLPTYKNRRGSKGQLAERSIAVLLKSTEPKGSESSNPSLSA